VVAGNDLGRSERETNDEGTAPVHATNGVKPRSLHRGDALVMTPDRFDVLGIRSEKGARIRLSLIGPLSTYDDIEELTNPSETVMFIVILAIGVETVRQQPVRTSDKATTRRRQCLLEFVVGSPQQMSERCYAGRSEAVGTVSSGQWNTSNHTTVTRSSS
jgi:hypothetical protein